ncbi:5-formyltetrahydrofolate cyclo-ligase [Oricola thermophila]|uniref:5-formyltetrahydrofolate cyclo-ligase n=1 Tax=Oricola thermophila TaxID=2742145 RepID=A0A6N1VCG5_9HYPH|nr:5-formyltetrahydrofolate cyclo-ligase [Oricola thermophila]QKV17255.1 5-formyltetrahydrofolate cyclo-ligase [Oricola thermophila]
MNEGTFSSPPCFAHELQQGPNGYEMVDERTATDVARWRKAERERLIAARLAVPMEERIATAQKIIEALDGLTAAYSRPAVALYWPFRGEPDLRGWMVALHGQGARVALPVVVAKGRPLVFREWHPECRMERGIWNIPVPAEDRRLVPDIVVSPVVGADRDGYRLGYGGGYYDRTLASLPVRPMTVGVGHPSAEIDTIFPQPHDIPFDRMILEGRQWERK